MKRATIVLVLLSLLAGCASYATPGRGADFAKMGVTPVAQAAGADPSIRDAFDKKPLAMFPTGIAVVRVQAPGYRSRTAQGWGYGRYCVVTTRDVEQPGQIEGLAKLPMVRGIAPLNRLLLSGDFNTDEPLRRAAAQLQADVLLIYTLDTTFVTEDKLRPLSVITLGLSPNQQVRLTTTASAVLLDTRNGYVYGVAEATERKDRLTSAWQNDVAIDETRRATESAAFGKLVGELETTWKGVVKNYASTAGVGG
jgi:hypothetical protein